MRFEPDLSDLLHKRNLAWARARKSKQNSDWLVFKQLRNACTVKIRTAKADHFLSQTSNSLNNTTKFWKIIKLLSENNNKGVELPPCIVKNEGKITDKAKMLDCFYEHFIASGFLFESCCPPNDCSSIEESVGQDTLNQTFSFSPVTVSEIHKALKLLVTTKAAGPDKLDPYFLKFAANVFAAPPPHF